MDEIRFGTSGWRGIIAGDFTFANARIVIRAIGERLIARGEKKAGVIVGHDNRFLGEEFSRDAAGVLAAMGIRSWLCAGGVPTPALAFEILRRQAAGGINFTASHNPPQYNGIKFSPDWGGPALPETTRDLEARIRSLQDGAAVESMDYDRAVARSLVEEIDPHPAYLERLKQLVDLEAIAGARLGLACNPLYGVGQGYLDRLLREAGADVITINDRRDPSFGGHAPDPSAGNMQDFIALVKSDKRLVLGLATDGDADRYGIVDQDGSFIEPNYILPLLADYLIRRRGTKKAVARTVATSHFVDAVARYHGIGVHETPVGFKYIGELIREDKILIGGEESAGLTVAGHVPEKDGILACLLVAEMVGHEGKSLKELLADLYRRVGSFFTQRINIRLTPALQKSFRDKLASPPSTLAGKKVDKLVTMDGSKFLFADGSWILFRLSGTEPVVRVYIESSSPEETERMAGESTTFISE
jgi:alpha-D-glucose phosphate-specific phosphoglucomutase